MNDFKIYISALTVYGLKEELGDHYNVVFAGLLLESAGKQGVGRGGSANPPNAHTHSHRLALLRRWFL
jgi:hypothetical protein